MRPAPPFPVLVVAVSGVSGAGKSTLVGALADRLGAARLHFDAYLTLGNDPAAIAAWLAGGVDPDRIETPGLVADLARLRAARDAGPAGVGQDAGPPGGAGPGGVVLLEEPFGRARRALAPMIDLSVHLDLPPEVALARRLLRAIEAGAGAPGLVRDLEAQLRAFLGGGRDVYAAADRAARAGADLVLDALAPPPALVARVVAAVRRRRGDDPTPRETART
ncbi:hypothetical protein OPKNFCMD_4150 [Methylobacterium crusticola]|uniref:Uridine kinase n=1 Tax=Methylobacterium crusticola TaxID=1697972 RepID=A0ABQ4R3I9_9HYPH|nr:hypothetical protein [Methylobacterium crusticola]GJD51396.1 hypothetical protein OPKNFCMD_4150 [Methylobacterium crusticola]